MSLARVGADRSNGEVQLRLGEQQQLVLDGATDVPAEVIMGARPEHTRLWESEGSLLGPIDGTVEYVESLGRETLIGVETAGAARFVIEADGRVRAEPGEAVCFGLRRGWVYLFDAGTEQALGRV
jgi:multiple sugar transport system ATP-binding protein